MSELRIRVGKPKIAFVGIGHKLCGDDAAGVVCARLLRWLIIDDYLVIEGGSAPENYTRQLRCYAPDLVLFIDAALMNTPPGSISILNWRAITGISASSHTLPLNILSSYLSQSLGCECVLLGIQPAQNAFGSRLSQPVREAIKEIASTLCTALSDEQIWRLSYKNPSMKGRPIANQVAV